MPIAFDDQARLPGLTSYDEVAERQRLADIKAFRQYLVETGTVKTLVKLYQHTAKTEMRLDNAKVLNQFLENPNHIEETAETRERDRLGEENAIMRQRRDEMQAQAEALATGIRNQTRLAVGKSLYQCIVSADFWEGEIDDDTIAAGFPMTLLYKRLCGQKLDKASRKVLVNLIRPFSHHEDELSLACPFTLESISEWVANVISEDMHVWIREDLLPRFSSVPVPNEPPYEREILQAIRDTGLPPDHMDEVHSIVSLDPNLVAFLNAIAEARF